MRARWCCGYTLIHAAGRRLYCPGVVTAEGAGEAGGQRVTALRRGMGLGALDISFPAGQAANCPAL